MSQEHSPAEFERDQTCSYPGYRGVPPLVGLQTMEESVAKGLPVAESVARLKRIYWALKRLHNIFVSRITAIPIYELKMAFSLHAYYCIEHVGAFAARMREMRQPPYGLEISPDAYLDAFFDEILCAPNVEALVLGLYERAIPAVIKALEGFVDHANRVFDHPSYRVCRLALVELRDVQEYGSHVARSLVSEEQRAALAGWLSRLNQMLAAAGSLDGTAAASGEAVDREFSLSPYVYDPVPKRDERFKDSYNMGVNAEAMIFDPHTDPRPKLIMLYFKRMREIDVPEMMSSILAETGDKPWEYQRDMTRQLWDEARHAMMGEIGFFSLGIDW